MTHAEAKQIFATHMQAARKRKLAPYETKQLSQARQVLRQYAKPAMNVRRKGARISSRVIRKVDVGRKLKVAKSNPAQPVLIYDEVIQILARKGQSHICDADCKRKNHTYYHDFESSPRMYGMPDKSILITHKRF